MGNTSLGTLAISMSLWAADLGAGHLGATTPPPSAPAAITAHTAPCRAGAQAPVDDSDLEVVVCAKPLR
jgi:hypothetical protein